MNSKQQTIHLPVATYSLVALDTATGDLGVVVASKFLAVGAVVPYARAGVGAVATQSYVNATFGPRSLEHLAAGRKPEDCLEDFRQSDNGLELRQFGVVAVDGSSLSFTGQDCHAWAGGKTGDGYAAQGNILTGPDVVEALVDSFLSRQDLAFPERMLAALSAADREGGDSRGRQAAALLVVGEAKGYGGLNDRWIDLRIDDHPEPIPELRRLLELQRLYFDKPSQPPYELNESDIVWLQAVLRAEGKLSQEADGQWNEATEKGLWGLYGIENLEERWLGGNSVDPVAWTYLRKQLAARA